MAAIFSLTQTAVAAEEELAPGFNKCMEEGRSGARIVKAMVPLAEMFGYVTALRTITSGRATSSMEYDHHSPLSSAIAKAVLEEVKGRADLV